MASSTAEPMPQTIDGYKKLAQRDLELVMEMRTEIGKLKARLNNLQQKGTIKDALRYEYMFSYDGTFDYVSDWMCEPKAKVDSLIDELIREG